MSNLTCGIDFGTSNSSAALSDGTHVRVLELDPSNDSPTSLPSLLYMASEGDRIIGRRAANAFIERNVDREVIMKQVDLGVDIEAYVDSEGDKEGGFRPRDPNSDVREAVRARARVEVNSPGRLFQSVKSSLRYVDYTGTEVFGQHYQIEELTAMILKPIKEAIDKAAGHPVETAVFGRPVHFSMNEEEDRTAENRLRIAGDLVGFKNVNFFYEPVAACVEYATAAEKKQRLMVVDIGGGTCDVCVMEFGGAHGAAARLAESKILGVGGVPVAGDALDREILRAKVFPQLGSRSRYGPSQLPMPQHIYNTIADWQNLYRLNTEEIINWLIATEMSSTQPEAIRGLRYLIQRNFGYPLTRRVEAAKKHLSFEYEADIELRKDDLQLEMTLTRGEFTNIITPTLEDMLESIQEAETSAQIKPEDIDYVLTTGGTSLIPAIRNMLTQRFGDNALLERDTFTSVASGLAIVSHFT
jgi:hypothetical chaperone protein